MKNKVVIKNSMIGILSQVMKILFTFLTRSLFVRYIGTELLGLNSTFTSVLSTLSVTEFGFQTAVAFSLYKPIHDKNEKDINDVMNIFKLVYRCIGIFFVIASIILLPFLKYIIKGIAINSTIYLFFLLQAAASACTYFLAYKRVILYADQKDYIAKFIDMVLNIIFNIFQCVSLALFKNYSFYLVLRIIQVVLSNVIINIYCSKNYSYLHRGKINPDKFKKIIGKTKLFLKLR